MDDVWKPISGYEGLYEVSNTGKIKGCERKINHSTEGYQKTWWGKEIKPSLTRKGYQHVSLCRGGKSKSYLVHRIVAKEFCKGFKENYDVNHKDGDKLNNHCENLEWVTRQQNIQHSFQNKLQTMPSGDESYTAKEYQIIYPCGVMQRIKSLNKFCQDNDLPRREFYRIMNGERESYKGYKIRKLEE